MAIESSSSPVKLTVSAPKERKKTKFQVLKTRIALVEPDLVRVSVGDHFAQLRTIRNLIPTFEILKWRRGWRTLSYY